MGNRHEVCLRFGLSLISLSFERESVSKRFSDVFRDALWGDSPAFSDMFYFVDGIGPFRVLRPDGVAEIYQSLGSLVYRVTFIACEMIRRNVSDSVCTVHSSSAVIGSRAVLFVGESGRGKSTFSLFASFYGGFLGDEYGFLDFDSCRVCQAPYPVQIKTGPENPFFKKAGSSCLPVESQEHNAILVCRSDLDDVCCVDYGWYSLGAIVFPLHDASAEVTSIRNISLFELPAKFLGSFRSSECPSGLLSRFLHLVSESHLPIVEVRYSDGASAARCLLESI